MILIHFKIFIINLISAHNLLIFTNLVTHLNWHHKSLTTAALTFTVLNRITRLTTICSHENGHNYFHLPQFFILWHGCTWWWNNGGGPVSLFFFFWWQKRWVLCDWFLNAIATSFLCFRTHCWENWWSGQRCYLEAERLLKPWIFEEKRLDCLNLLKKFRKDENGEWIQSHHFTIHQFLWPVRK